MISYTWTFQKKPKNGKSNYKNCGATQHFDLYKRKVLGKSFGMWIIGGYSWSLLHGQVGAIWISSLSFARAQKRALDVQGENLWTKWCVF